MKLVSVAEMKAIEEQANAAGLSYAQMMENAGRGLARLVQSLELEKERQDVVGLVGPGNNGGDTLVALSLLAADGWSAHAYLIQRRPDALTRRLEQAGGEVLSAETDKRYKTLTACLEQTTVLLDGVLGTGIKLPLKESVAKVLERAKAVLNALDEPPLVIAVDCPSGVDCESGEAAPEAIPADVTVSMAAVKRGLTRLPAFALTGSLVVVDIGLADALPSWQTIQAEVVDRNRVAGILPRRPLDAHKGTFGTALIVAGSVNYTGATLLAGQAAYRVGAGLVTLAVPSPLHSVLAGQFPEATWLLLPHELGVIAADAAEVVADNLERATAMLLGPGFGLEETTQEFLENLLTGKAMPRKSAAPIGFVRDSTEATEPEEGGRLPPLVFDADGLKLLARLKEWPRLLPCGTILTPHPGEMAILSGLSKEEIQRQREAVAQRFAKEWGHVLVLKGAFTVVASPDGRYGLIPVASPALARAGSGDVLAGLIVGLRAQGVEAFEAALAGAWIHAQAGLHAAEALGTTASVLAGDVLNAVSKVLAELD